LVAKEQDEAEPQEPQSPQDSGPYRAPEISRPKGGGAIRGIGEKFAANPVNGTAALTLPIFTSPGRGGFDPALSLSYDSGAGNSAYGFGWQLALPSITRRTDKGLPLYDDAGESDVYILSGAEDLVPALTPVNGEWTRAPKQRLVNGQAFSVQEYRPRVEGLFARIERWTNVADTSVTRWRSIARDNVFF